MSLRRDYIIIVTLSIILFIIAIAEKILFGLTSYFFLVVASPPLIIFSIVNSYIFFHLVLFLYYLFIVWIGHLCFKKGKIIFIIMVACLLILHLMSYLYVMKGIDNIANSLIEGAIRSIK